MDVTRKLVGNLYAGGVGALAALVTHKLVDGAWRLVTGEEPPEPDDPSTPLSQALVWALAMAIGVGVSQVLVNRLAAQRWKSFTGEDLPIRRVNLKL